MWDRQLGQELRHNVQVTGDKDDFSIGVGQEVGHSVQVEKINRETGVIKDKVNICYSM